MQYLGLFDPVSMQFNFECSVMECIQEYATYQGNRKPVFMHTISIELYK